MMNDKIKNISKGSIFCMMIVSSQQSKYKQIKMN